MRTKRRAFIKALGIGSGILITDQRPLFGQAVELDTKFQDWKSDVFLKRVVKADLLVAGGGMAGICAAIAAARNGRKVILVQNRSRLGGNASSEIRMHVSGASALQQVWRETGILEELMLEDAVRNPQRSYEIWDFILYDKVVSEPNITLLLDTAVTAVHGSTDKISHVMAFCSPTEELYEIHAEYFADCTGDATLAALAGASHMVGREAKSKWNESLGVENADKLTMGNSILFQAQKHDKPMPFYPPTWARKYGAKDFVHRGIDSLEYGYWWLELGGMEDSVKDGQKNRRDLLATLFGVWDYIKNSGDYPDATNWALSWVGMIPGKRESRRVVGDYIMTQDDIQTAKLFEDRVAYGGWPLDDHPPGGMDTTNNVPLVSIPLKKPYSIPLRSLYSKDMSNLLMAGRNVSVSHVALSSTRVMATCAIMGQAIGTAVAYCLQQKLALRKLTTDKVRLKVFQQLLLRQDQSILGLRNEDVNDLARSAKVTASSETEKGSAQFVIDGVNRIIDDGQSHQWQAPISESLPFIELKWDREVSVGKVILVFDTGLHRYLRISPQDVVYQNQIRGAQPETISDYTISVDNGNEWMPIVQVEGNYQRRVEHIIGPVSTNRLRLTVIKTNGDSLARLFEIRCYT